ncbi:MAG: GNAT family N-acetyltransferase [Solobacterium sp.]|nr:GNAT family N-acetyltransferase [Solobacterium sp.]
MTGTIELTTERLLLRRYRLDDALVLYEEFGCDPQMYEYSGWNPYASYDMAVNTVQDFINSYNDPHFYGWAIEFQEQLIGTIGAYDYDPVKNQIETGFSIARNSWGNGFASESLICVLRYLAGQEDIETVTAWCAADNTGSMKTMQKAGMKQTAIEKDALEVNGKKFDKLIFQYSSH